MGSLHCTVIVTIYLPPIRMLYIVKYRTSKARVSVTGRYNDMKRMDIHIVLSQGSVEVNVAFKI